jgi:hypothetical protein
MGTSQNMSDLKTFNIFQIAYFFHLSVLLAPLLPLAFFVTHGYVFANVALFLILPDPRNILWKHSYVNIPLNTPYLFSKLRMQ